MIPGKGPHHPTFRRSFLFAVQGFRVAVSQERNIKVMLGGAAFALVMGILSGLTVVEWAVVLMCCGSVIAAELMNTAIETVVDLVSPEYHPLAGKAKDIAAAAVWVLSVFAAIVGIALFVNGLVRRFW